MNKHKTYFNWSSGKDSALALYLLLQDDRFSVEELITTINSHYNRVSMHGLRKELLLAQTDALNIPASVIELPEMPSMTVYEQKMLETVSRLKKDGFTHTAFGDIFLEDLRAYREQQLAKQNLKAVFPIWKRDTKELLNEFLDLGFKTITKIVSFNEISYLRFNLEANPIIIEEILVENNPRLSSGQSDIISEPTKKVCQPRDIGDMFKDVPGFSVVKRGGYAMDPVFR